ncbi:MAG: hypothetical protein HXS44_06965, partial [Theionarchaea archaeon]|nr:hypothetical protein [Theionarchaea archaeon]
MKMSRKVFVLAAMGILVFSMVSVSAHQEKATIHVQTCGYEGRNVVTLHVDITGEDSDFLYIDVNAGVLNRIIKEINIELLPIYQINDTTFAVPKTYLSEIEPHEFITVVPNNVVKMKWSIKDKIKTMNGNDIVRVLVWFKDPEAGKVLNKFGDVYYSFLSGMGASMDIRVSNIKSLSEEATIEFVEAEGTAHVMLSDVVSHINADDVWGMGYDGTGIKICFVDTGIDAN